MEKIGIFDFIKAICTHYTTNTPSSFCLELLWSPSYNAFLLSNRSMTITLLEIAAITSFLVAGSEINANLLTNGLPYYDFPLMSTSYRFNQF